MEEFVTFIRGIINIDDSALQTVLSRCTETAVPKGKLLLRQGQVATQYFYLLAGGIRFFYHTEDQENTTWVMFENEFFTEISSLNAQLPTRFNIQAIEETKLVVINKKDMDFLYAQIPVWQEFGRRIWEATTTRMIDQIISFQTLSAEERYLAFLENAEGMEKIPVHQLAAVIGITPNALSRIRKNIR